MDMDTNTKNIVCLGKVMSIRNKSIRNNLGGWVILPPPFPLLVFP